MFQEAYVLSSFAGRSSSKGGKGKLGSTFFSLQFFGTAYFLLQLVRAAYFLLRFVRQLIYCCNLVKYKLHIKITREWRDTYNNQDGIVNALFFFWSSRITCKCAIKKELHANVDFHNSKCYEINILLTKCMNLCYIVCIYH